LHEEVKSQYRAGAVNPHTGFYVHTGRPLARRLGYDEAVVAAFPDSAVEAFAGVGNPFSLGTLKRGAGSRSRLRRRLRLLYRGGSGQA
jgi:hypothetical protein